MVAMFTPVCNAFRLYDDDAGEAASTPLQAQDVDHTFTITANTAFQIRYRVDETGGADGKSTDDYDLEYAKNAGSWVALTGTDIGDGIHAVAAGLTNDAATTNRSTNGISDPGGGIFRPGEQSSDGVVDDILLSASDFTEHVYGVEIVDANVSDADTFDIRIASVTTPQALIPQITVDKAAGPANLTVSQTEGGDTQAAALQLIGEIAASQAEGGDTQAAALQLIGVIAASQAEAGDTQVAAIEVVALAARNITASQAEAGDSQAAALQLIGVIAASQAEAGDTQAAAISALLAAVLSGVLGDAPLGVISLAALNNDAGAATGNIITAIQAEAGDSTAALLQLIGEIAASQAETGDTQAAALQLIGEIAASQTEGGDTQAAALQVIQLVANITASQAEAGDSTAALLQLIGEIAASQAEAGDTQAAGLQLVVTLTASQAEAGDTQSSRVITLGLVEVSGTVYQVTAEVRTVTIPPEARDFVVLSKPRAITVKK